MNGSEAFLEFRYQLIKQWEQGKEVYLVKDVSTGRLAIKKIVKPIKSNIYEKIKQIKHPNLVEVFDVCELDNKAVIYEEFVEGENLREKVEQNGPYTEKEAGKIITQVCDGLEHLHQSGIINRDITPENIMVTPDGRVKIIDFNIARINKKKNRDTSLMGTVGYAAPEQYGFEESDERTDIYAVGILLNYLLTGVLPDEYLYDKKRKYKVIITQCTQIAKGKRYRRISDVKAVIQAGNMSYQWQRFVKGIPGFRTGKKYKMCIAVLGYPLIFLWVCIFPMMMISDLKASSNWWYIPLMVLITIFQVCIPFALITNAGDLDAKVFKMKHLSKGKRFIIHVVISYLLIYVWGGLMLLGDYLAN